MTSNQPKLEPAQGLTAPRKPLLHYTLRYVLALAIIAALALYSFAAMRTHIRIGVELASYVDDAIYQYAVANRIVASTHMVMNAATKDEQQNAMGILQRDYAEMVTTFAKVHGVVDSLRATMADHITPSAYDHINLLLYKHETIDSLPGSVEALYYDDPYNLDEHFRNIISLTESFLASSSPAEQKEIADELAAIIKGNVSEGSRLVSLGLQQIAEYQIAAANSILRIYTVTALVVLLLIGGFMFRPLFRHVVATDNALREKMAEQKNTLALVEQTETRLRVALEGMQDGLWDWDLATNNVYYSDRWLSMLGYGPGDLPPTIEAWQKVLHPGDRKLAYQHLEQHFADANQPYQVTLRYIHKDGGVRNILARGKALRDASGKPYRMMGGHTDVTELTKIQQTLSEQKLILELFTENTPVAVTMLDRQLRLLNVSTRWLVDYGLTKQAAIGQSFFATHSHFPLRWSSALRDALSGIASFADEDSFEKINPETNEAETVFVRWRVQPWRDSQGFVGGVILFSEMISEAVHLRRDVARASGLNQALAEFVSTELLYEGSATEPSIEEICRFAAKSVQVSRTGVWRMDDDGDIATNVRLFDTKDESFQSGQQLQRVDCFNFFARLSMNRPAIFDDAANSDLISPSLLTHLGNVNVMSAICVPIRVEQKIWGFLSLASDTPRAWQNYELFFSQRLADVVAISLTAHQRHLLNTSLIKAREEAETATVTKSRFVANMSHEVRTPLNGIVGVAEILSRTALDSKQSELVGVLQNSCQHLLAIVSDILDFSKLEAGSVTLENIPFNMLQLLRELTDLIRPNNEDSKVEIIVSYQPRLPQAFIGDPTRIRQVLMNLLSNAVKFTSAGSIVVAVKGVELEGGLWRIDLSVTDSGIGIPADKIDTLFDKFTQADSSTTRKYGGTGLGLTIIKELAELMGGKVSVHSAEGHGSTFAVTMPLQVDRTVPAALPPATLRSTRVLLLDDNQHAQQAILDALQGLGVRAEACDGPDAALEAIEVAARDKVGFDVLLVDVESNDSSNAMFAQKIKQSDKTRDLSLVALRASDKATEDFLLTKGFVTSQKKPVLPSDLMHVLQGVMQARRTGNMTTLYASGHTAAKAPADQLGTLQNARILLAEDNETNQMILTHFLTELGCKPVIAANGREAVAIFTRTLDFAAIIMDCQMPEQDGFAATAAIRALPHGSKVPILALTANTQSGDRERCLQAGMNDYMSKPVRMETLRQKLLGLLARPPAAGQPSAPTTKPVPEKPTQAIVLKDLQNAFSDDWAVINRVMTSFMQNARSLLSQADAQLSAGDMAALAKTAHALKGASLSVYAGPMADDAKQLEKSAGNSNSLECGYLLNLLRRHADQIEQTTIQWASKNGSLTA